MANLEMTIEQLSDLLVQQKAITAEYITRNLTTYKWFNDHPDIDIDIAKKQLKLEVIKSGFPDDFEVLKKYMK